MTELFRQLNELGGKALKVPKCERAKCPTKIEKSVEYSLLRAEGFSGSMDVFYGSLAISKLQFDFKKSSPVYFFSLWSSKPWIRIYVKCWIRIRNTAFYINKSYQRGGDTGIGGKH